MIDVKGNLKVGVVTGVIVTGVIYVFNKFGINEINKYERSGIKESEEQVKLLEAELYELQNR